MWRWGEGGGGGVISLWASPGSYCSNFLVTGRNILFTRTDEPKIGRLAMRELIRKIKRYLLPGSKAYDKKMIEVAKDLTYFSHKKRFTESVWKAGLRKWHSQKTKKKRFGRQHNKLITKYYPFPFFGWFWVWFLSFSSLINYYFKLVNRSFNRRSATAEKKIIMFWNF